MKHSLPLLALLAVGGCKPPPDAPTNLDDLCGYLYAHTADEEAGHLQAGLVNLDAWLEHSMDETTEGYAISQLSQETVNTLDDVERDVSDVRGAAVGNDGDASVDQTAYVLVAVDPMELFPDSYNFYEREITEGEGCFLDHGCDWMVQHNSMEINYALGLVAGNKSTAHLRWVDTEQGPALVHRTWLEEPAEINWDWLGVPEQYYLNIVMPRGDGHHRRLQATWMVVELGDNDLDEGVALNLVISSMQSGGEIIDQYYAGEIE